MACTRPTPWSSTRRRPSSGCCGASGSKVTSSCSAPGGADAAGRQGGTNLKHDGHPGADTADWNDDRGPGNLRVDYVLPSADLEFVDGGVFWPTADAPLMGTTLDTVERASDHRLVWVDVEVK